MEEYRERLRQMNQEAFALTVSTSQRSGVFSRRLLRHIWDWDTAAIRGLPRSTEQDDWVRLPRYEVNTSALWVVLCEIISPRMWFERGNSVSYIEYELLFLLIHRRPAGARLRGCIHVMHTAEHTRVVGSLRKSMDPLSAVLYLAQVACEMDARRLDPRQPCRAADCMRTLIRSGARTEDLDPLQVRKAFRDPRCQKAIRVLLNEGQLCVRHPSLAAELYLQFCERNIALASAFEMEAEAQQAMALEWALAVHARLGDLVRVIGEAVFPLCSFLLQKNVKVAHVE